MAIQKTEKIWHNGKFIAWDDATLHVMSHVVHYGSSVFEGIRCYALPTGPAIFRAREHMQRLINSARIYRIDVPFIRDEIVRAMIELVQRNGVWPCYIRPRRSARIRRGWRYPPQLPDRGLHHQLSLGKIFGDGRK